MTDDGCTSDQHCSGHVRKYMQSLASRIVDGRNICVKVGSGHWNRRVATCDIEGDHVILREAGMLSRIIWSAPISMIKHRTFRDNGDIQRFEAPGHEPLMLFEVETVG